MKRVLGIAFLFALTHAATAQVDRFYGEPVELKSNFIYFTSWQYVDRKSVV